MFESRLRTPRWDVPIGGLPVSTLGIAEVGKMTENELKMINGRLLKRHFKGEYKYISSG